MNVNQIINMVIRLFVRNILNRGINGAMRGAGKLSRGMRGSEMPPPGAKEKRRKVRTGADDSDA